MRCGGWSAQFLGKGMSLSRPFTDWFVSYVNTSHDRGGGGWGMGTLVKINYYWHVIKHGEHRKGYPPLGAPLNVIILCYTKA